MKVVVTGGAGFIGANTCRALEFEPGVDEVVAFDDLSTGFATNLEAGRTRLVTGSLLDRDLLTDTVRGASSVIHLAARPSVPRSLQDPVASHAVNATGTLYVLEAARQAGAHVVVASSSSVYGGNLELPKRESATPRPLSPYAVSKLATESYALSHQTSFGLETLALRFFNVYGPLQAAGHAYAAVVPAFIDAALAGRPLVVQGDGQQTRDFTHVSSVVDVLLEAVRERRTHPTPVNLAFGTRASVLVLVEHLEQVLGRSLPVEHVPARVGDVRDSQAASELLRELFPSARAVPLEDGLVDTVAWFRSTLS